MIEQHDPERAARAAAANAALEGHHPSEHEKALYDAYVEGSLSIDELARALAKAEAADA